MKLKLTLVVVAMGFVSCLNAQTADEILAKYFENTGGIDKWEELKTLTMVGKLPTPQGDFPLKVYAKSPNKTKVVLNVQGQEIVQAAYDGETAWTLNPFAGGTEPVKLDDEQAKEIKDQNVEDDFIDYKSKGHVVTLQGKEEIDGVQCFTLKLEKNKNNDKDDVTKIYYFDTENYVPLMYKSYIQSGPQKGTEMQTFMSDYQEAGGLMMPFYIEQKINGQTVSKIVVEKYLVNEDIDDSVFAFSKK